MKKLSRLLKPFLLFSATALCLGFGLQTRMQAQDRKAGKWNNILGGMVTILSGGTSVVGAWQGGKTENNPFSGGYLNLTFRFNFSADGSYQEAAYMGSSQVMFARGHYQSSGGGISFEPEQCLFSAEDFRQIVKLFPIPTDTNAQDAISFSALAGGGQLTLKDVSSGEDWGLKPLHN